MLAAALLHLAGLARVQDEVPIDVSGSLPNLVRFGLAMSQAMFTILWRLGYDVPTLTQSASCGCGQSKFKVNGVPIGRFKYHCTIRQNLCKKALR